MISPGIGVKIKKYLKPPNLDHIPISLDYNSGTWKTSFSPRDGSCLSGPLGSSPVPSWTAACPSSKLAPNAAPKLRDTWTYSILLEPNSTSPWHLDRCFTSMNMQHVYICKYNVWVICNVKKAVVVEWLNSGSHSAPWVPILPLFPPLVNPTTVTTGGLWPSGQCWHSCFNGSGLSDPQAVKGDVTCQGITWAANLFLTVAMNVFFLVMGVFKQFEV